MSGYFSVIRAMKATTRLSWLSWPGFSRMAVFALAAERLGDHVGRVGAFLVVLSEVT